LNTAERGDSIELGLLVSPITISTQGFHPNTESPPIDDLLTAAPLQSNGPVKVIIRISHKYAPSETHQGASHPKDVVTTEIRQKPCFDTLFLRRILRQIDGNLNADLPPPEAFTSGRTCDLEMVLDRAPLPTPAPPTEDGNQSPPNEPTLEQLSSFGETLKGKRVTLYASARGSFAHHLTSYLTAWGMDVTHVSPDGHVDGLADQNSSSSDDGRAPSFGQYSAGAPGSPGKSDQRSTPPEGPAFIVVDDDIDILKDRLQALRFESQPSFMGPSSRKRPQLSTRTRSTSQVARFLGINNLARPSSPVVILYFTSLANYKAVREFMQSITISYTATSTPLPEVMIIPKPAGPRRFLTALHTAVTKPNVDPMFTPIATSPSSPSVREADGSFFPLVANDQNAGTSASGGHPGSSPQIQSPGLKNTNRPRGSRTSSDRSTASNGAAGPNALSILPPSPLALPDNVEYFSAAAQKLGTSPSSGLVIQSPDGQTAGIYFHPRSKSASTSRNPSSRSMERGNGQLVVPDTTRGPPMQRTPSGSGRTETTTSFAVLHEVHRSTARPALNPSPSPTSPLSASPTAQAPRAPRLRSVGPVEENKEGELQPSLSMSILSPVPRRKSEDKQGLAAASPTEGGPSTPIRRAGAKRGSDAKEPAVPTKKRGKTFGSDANVVPPISVLIVDGMCLSVHIAMFMGTHDSHLLYR
jgi:osomolarity two-component system response regulator SSK1